MSIEDTKSFNTTQSTTAQPGTTFPRHSTLETRPERIAGTKMPKFRHEPNEPGRNRVDDNLCKAKSRYHTRHAPVHVPLQNVYRDSCPTTKLTSFDRAIIIAADYERTYQTNKPGGGARPPSPKEPPPPVIGTPPTSPLRPLAQASSPVEEKRIGDVATSIAAPRTALVW